MSKYIIGLTAIILSSQNLFASDSDSISESEEGRVAILSPKIDYDMVEELQKLSLGKKEIAKLIQTDMEQKGQIAVACIAAKSNKRAEREKTKRKKFGVKIAEQKKLAAGYTAAGEIGSQLIGAIAPYPNFRTMSLLDHNSYHNDKKNQLFQSKPLAIKASSSKNSHRKVKECESISDDSDQSDNE